MDDELFFVIPLIYYTFAHICVDISICFLSLLALEVASDLGYPPQAFVAVMLPFWYIFIFSYV